MELLLFDIGGEPYGVALDEVDEVLHLPALRAIPTAPPFLAGVFNLRGALIPVIDIQERLGRLRTAPPPPLSASEPVLSPYPRGTRLLLVTVEGMRYGVIMDRWQGIRDLEEGSHREGVLKGEAKSSFIYGLQLLQEGMVQRVVLRQLLRSDELALLRTQQAEMVV